MINEHIGMLLSLCGMIITILSFQAKDKKTLLILQSVGTVFYLVSYIFSDGGVAVWLNCIFLIRNFIYMNVDNRGKAVRYLSCASLCAAYIAIYIIFVLTANRPLSDCLWSFLPIAGGIFGTVAVVNVNVNRLRLFKLGDSLSWLVYNAHIGLGALGGIIGEILNIISIITAFLRYSKNDD